MPSPREISLPTMTAVPLIFTFSSVTGVVSARAVVGSRTKTKASASRALSRRFFMGVGLLFIFLKIVVLLGAEALLSTPIIPPKRGYFSPRGRNAGKAV